MDGASRMFAAPIEETIGGRKLRINPQVAEMRGEVEQHILSLRPNPLQVARDNVELFAGSPALQSELMRLAMQEACRIKSVARFELAEWLATVEGTVYILWLQSKDCNQPSPTLDEIGELYDAEVQLAIDAAEGGNAKEVAGDVLERIQEKMNKPSGEDELGNSTGPL
jgi:hypothetical protein